MSWIGVIAAIVQLAVLILADYFNGRSRAREEEKRYQVSIDEFDRMARSALDRMRDRARREGPKAPTGDDAVDREIRAKPG